MASQPSDCKLSLWAMTNKLCGLDKTALLNLHVRFYPRPLTREKVYGRPCQVALVEASGTVRHSCGCSLAAAVHPAGTGREGKGRDSLQIYKTILNTLKHFKLWSWVTCLSNVGKKGDHFQQDFIQGPTHPMWLIRAMIKDRFNNSWIQMVKLHHLQDLIIYSLCNCRYFLKISLILVHYLSKFSLQTIKDIVYDGS